MSESTWTETKNFDDINILTKYWDAYKKRTPDTQGNTPAMPPRTEKAPRPNRRTRALNDDSV
jgi:hypothetical protein